LKTIVTVAAATNGWFRLTVVGLLRMGERYRDGDDVPKDLGKAKVYLQKAADAGSSTAAEELKKLPVEPVQAVK
jgi:TPR repeat protein